MEPVAALGVAAAAVQFLSFTGEIISKSREIYRSADGTLLVQSELDTLAKSLRSQCLPLRNFIRAERRTAFGESEAELRSLCRNCIRVADELGEALEKLKVHDTRHRKWTSFRQALNSVRTEDEIEQLSKRLERYRNQIDTTLLFILRQKIDEVDAKQGLSSANISNIILGAVNDNKKWQADLIKSVHQQKWDHHNQSSIVEFSMLLSTSTDNQRKDHIEADILRRLRFQTMHDRHERIPDAYSNTFEWVFDEPDDMRMEQTWDSYVQWLRGIEPIYWITGKPGAGKSTLTKFLFNDPRTRHNAALWSGPTELISAGFFFWNSGTELQMSQEGLLKTLLYQIIWRRRDLIPVVFNDSWQNYERWGGDLDDWRWQDLAKALKALLSDKRHNFLLFIDGLDEFDGDHMELVNFIKELAQFPNVKLCVASRPWLTFEEAFGKRPRLRVETLTRSDIQRFVSEKLRASERFLDLEREKPTDARFLIDEVTGKAYGVFLWVYLVVRSLLDGLRDGDSMKDLITRITYLPSDLEELFRKILDHLEPLYFKQASILFQLLEGAAPKPLTVLCLAFSEEGLEAAMHTKMEALTHAQRASRAESVRRRLNSRSKGLLEATPAKRHPDRSQVQYLHRTVKDFLARRDVWTYITSGTDSSFNVHEILCGTYLLHLKTMLVSEFTQDPSVQLETLEYTWDAVRGCLDHASKAEDALGRKQIKFFDEMDKATGQVVRQWEDKQRRSPMTHWTDTLVWFLGGDLDSRTWLDCNPCTSFFEYAFCRGLYHYTEYKISSREIPVNQDIKGRTLLCLATQRGDDRMMQFLLERKADPNLAGKQCVSAWQILLQILDTSYCTNTEVWFDRVTLFLEHGADPEGIAHQLPAFSIIETAFGGWNSDRMKQLLLQMLSKKRSLKTRKDWPKHLFKQKDVRYLQANARLVTEQETSIPLPDFAIPEWAMQPRRNTTFSVV